MHEDTRLHSNLSLKSLKSIDVTQTHNGTRTKQTESVKSLNTTAKSVRLGNNTPQNNRSFNNENMLYHKTASANGTIADVDYLRETNDTASLNPADHCIRVNIHKSHSKTSLREN